MTLFSTRRPKKLNSLGMFVVLAASLAVHGAIVVTASFGTGQAGASKRSTEKMTTVAYQYSCWSDASLGMSARSLACSMRSSKSDCVAQAFSDYRFDLILCDGLRDTPEVNQNTVALMSAKELAVLQATPLLEVPEITALKLTPKQEAEQKILPLKQPGQVVEVLEPGLESEPDNARFMSEYNTRVEKESVARGSTAKMVDTPLVKELSPSEESEETASGPKSAKHMSNLDSDNTKTHGSDDKVLQRLALRAHKEQEKRVSGVLDGSQLPGREGFVVRHGEGVRNQKAKKATEGEDVRNGGAGQRGGVPNLRLGDKALSRVAGGGSVDKLDGVASGEFTALNSKKWKFAGFFNRMKRRVAQDWHPAQVYAKRDPKGKVYGVKNRITVLEVSLKPNGSLAKVIVTKTSGVDFLDNEAVSAFQKAQPFPNPPTGLVSASSKLIRFSFGFHFQVGSRRDSWRVFKQ